MLVNPHERNAMKLYRQKAATTLVAICLTASVSSIEAFYSLRRFDDMFSELAQVARELESACSLDAAFTSRSSGIDVVEEDDTYVIKVFAPGLSKEDFTIELLEGRLLSISADVSKNESLESGRSMSRTSIDYRITLAEVDLTRNGELSAEYKESDVLVVRVPKKVARAIEKKQDIISISVR
jgi:HSP20 family protein